MATHQDTEKSLDALREALARHTGTRAQDWFLAFKARYAMRELFAAVGAVRGPGQVVTTLCTGCTAIDAILEAGMEPAYADVDPATLGIDADRLSLGPDARVVLLQHTYGMVDTRAAQICAEEAHAAGALLVDDSAHCLCRMARDGEGRPLADVNVQSFGVEKTLSNIYFGGAIWVSPRLDGTLRAAIEEAFSALEPVPARIASAAERYRLQTRILAHLPRTISNHARAWLVGSGLHEPPVAAVEREGRLRYPSYQPSAWMADQIVDQIDILDDDERRRLACAEVYREGLAGLPGLRIPEAALTIAADQPLIRFPVVLPTKGEADALREALMAEGFYCVPWYHVPFFPGATDLGAYGMSEDDPAYRAYLDSYAGTVGLPTDIPPERIPRAVEIVRAQLGA